jgi:16S rRNA processing protein RimM
MSATGDWIIVGKIHGAFGIRGWVKVESFTEQPEALIEQSQWWLGNDGTRQAVAVLSAQQHGRGFIAQLAGCEDRDAAERLRGQPVSLPVSVLPALGEGEHYWRDLLGCAVVSCESGQERLLGELVDVMDTGANDVMVVKPSAESVDDKHRLLPYTKVTVLGVEPAAKRIEVFWPADYDL